MKNLVKILLVLVGIVGLGIGSVRAEAINSDELSVSLCSGKYTLSKNDGEVDSVIFESESLSELIASPHVCEGSTLNFDNINVISDFEIKEKSFTLTGDITASGADITILDSNLQFEKLNLKLLGGSVRLKSGQLGVFESKITSNDKSCITLDRSAEARLVIESGEIYSSNQASAIYSSLGTVEISGGEIKSAGSAALESKSSLKIGADAKLEGKKYDIISLLPVTLSVNGKEIKNQMKIKYDIEFKKGSITPIAYLCSLESAKRIQAYDSYGREVELSFFESSPYLNEFNFGAVYLPYSVKYYSGAALICEKELLSSDSVLNIKPNDKVGYSFLSWSYDPEGKSLVDPSAKPSSDLEIYANYELMKLEYLINSKEFIYDGNERTLGFEYLTHPLMNEGEVYYEWFFEGNAISTQKELKLSSVSNSGEYKCKLTFTYNGDTSSIITPPVRVEIHPYSIELPEDVVLEYSASYQLPQFTNGQYFDIIGSGGVDVGEYEVILKLKDFKNFRFKNQEGNSVVFRYQIIKAENVWVEPPFVNSVYEGASPEYGAAARFGGVKFLFSEAYDGNFTEDLPISAGTYYMKTVVFGTENYSALESSVFSFEIIRERVIGLSMTEQPKTSYRAFEHLSLDGAKFVALYNSGRLSEISCDNFEVVYNSADSFRFGDKSVALNFEDAVYILPVSVGKAIYDISSISFENKASVYDGSAKSIEFFGSLPTGLDGITLGAVVEGFGVDAGEYIIKLVFYTDSTEYEAPPPITRTLFIAPLERCLVWKSLEYVYSGKIQAPSAYFIDELGERVNVSVSGGGINAGKHIAYADYSDANYHFVNQCHEFTINKADYDLSSVHWSDEGFVYDGEEKRVYVSGLPLGVEIVGYVDNKGRDAGFYKTYVSVSYDSQNYNEPRLSPHDWCIERAEYDISGFAFYDTEIIYDGEEHYPLFVGELPVGLDGSSPEYSFSRGAVSVSDGRFAVTVSFISRSNNYKAPEDIVSFVQILPRGILLEWSGENFVYTGNELIPKAYSKESSLRISGGAVDAGNYTAIAECLDSNYYPINSRYEYSVAKAENAWLSPVSISGLYEGEEFSVYASALSGSVVFKFYLDEACSFPISRPGAVGRYYCVAESDGGKNYLPIKSAVISFEILPHIPESLSVLFKKESFSAFEVIAAEDIEAHLVYNSGKREPLPFESLSITYPEGSLRAGNDLITISSAGVSVTVPILVKKADFDLSRVKWSYGEFVYDGEEKYIYLDMLPDGLSVIEYIGNGCAGAGNYEVYPVLSYDAENYNPPYIENGALSVKKRVLKLPESLAADYNGKTIYPEIENPELLDVSGEFRSSGSYTVTLTLKDRENYEILGDDDGIVELLFIIEPRLISINISDLTIGSGEEFIVPEYSVTGEVIEGDELGLVFFCDGEFISCYAENPNYKLEVVRGRLIREPAYSKREEYSPYLLSVFLLFLLLSILSFILIMRKRRRSVILSEILALPAPPSVIYLPEPEEISESVEEKAKGNAELFEIDAIRADELISDEVAKTLIHKNQWVATWGRKHSIINIDTLSENFREGERVDINAIKNKRLIPADASKIKVLARGVLNKRLVIYANGFSISAVKMIALTGGEAIKVKTISIKRPHERDE